MKKHASNLTLLESREGFMSGLGGLIKNKTKNTNNMGIMRFAEGGEVMETVKDNEIRNFLMTTPGTVPYEQNRFRGEESRFINQNPKLTELLRSLIVARRLGDRGEMNPEFAQSYKDVLEEANNLGLRQLAFGFDNFALRKLYDNPFEQPSNVNMIGVAQKAKGGEVDAVPMQQGGDPYAAEIIRSETGMDPITRQLLFGLDGKGGFIPGAFRAAEKTFFDEEGKARVVPEEVAGFSADQLRAQELARQAVGTQDPFLQQAQTAYQSGIADLNQGLTEQADLLRTTAGAYDPSMTQRFMDPYEQAVVDRTSQDLIEQFAKSDIGSRAEDIVRGGASAFGSRGKLGAAERTRALGRGLAEAIGGIRSRGFQQAQSTGLGEFARQQDARRALAGGLGSIGAARQAGQFGLGSALSGLGTQTSGARTGDIGMLSNLGSSQQQLSQQQLDAQRRNLLTAQQAPLAQYSALRPFVSMAPQGQFQTQTTFAPPPSPLQAGLGMGLSAFGALGKYFNQGQPQQENQNTNQNLLAALLQQQQQQFYQPNKQQQRQSFTPPQVGFPTSTGQFFNPPPLTMPSGGLNRVLNPFPMPIIGDSGFAFNPQPLRSPPGGLNSILNPQPFSSLGDSGFAFNPPTFP